MWRLPDSIRMIVGDDSLNVKDCEEETPTILERARMLTSIDAARDFEADNADVGFDSDIRLLFQMARTILWMLFQIRQGCSRWQGR